MVIFKFHENNFLSVDHTKSYIDIFWAVLKYVSNDTQAFCEQ